MRPDRRFSPLICVVTWLLVSGACFHRHAVRGSQPLGELRRLSPEVTLPADVERWLSTGAAWKLTSDTSALGTLTQEWRDTSGRVAVLQGSTSSWHLSGRDERHLLTITRSAPMLPVARWLRTDLGVACTVAPRPRLLRDSEPSRVRARGAAARRSRPMPVRVLALYTIDVTEQEADAAQHLPRELVVALKYANSAFARSQVDLELELADLKPFPHRRGPLLADYLKHTLCPSVSPQGQALFAERKAAAADIVVVITSSTAGDEPGWANQPDAAQADAWWPHATAVVTRVQGLQAQHNFAHEIAHVMGAGHQRTGGEPTYAHGHIWPGGRTIMATVRTRLVDYFSNPDVRLDALTSLGIPGQVDNARMLNENAPLVSTWAERAVPGTAVTCP